MKGLDIMIKNLLKIKSIVTLALTLTFVYLSVTGIVEGSEFITIFTVVIGFYFGTQKLDEEEKEQEQDEKIKDLERNK